MLQLLVLGNLGNDPEMRYSSGGQPFLRFNVAGNIRVRGDDGEWSDKTEWVRVTVFGQRAETLSNYLRKGTRVFVQGRLEARPWTDREGQVRAGLEVIGDQVEFMNPRGDGENGGYQPQQQQRSQAPRQQQGSVPADPDDLEELPF